MFICYNYLTKFDDVGKRVFELFQKLHLQICVSQFMTNYSTSICPFESGNCGKEGEKLQKKWISWERKGLFRWNKKHISVFKGLSFGSFRNLPKSVISSLYPYQYEVTLKSTALVYLMSLEPMYFLFSQKKS